MSVVLSDLGYLVSSYLTLGYLAPFREGAQASQVKLNLGALAGSQVEGTVQVSGAVANELRTGYFPHNYCPDGNAYLEQPYLTVAYLGPRLCVSGGSQVSLLHLQGVASQARPAIYNTNNLRILCDFPSRGNGNNWTASSTEPSTTDSFDILNVNTDIDEQVWRSATGVKTGILLDCDAGAGFTIFLDTLAFLNHNMTTSANVVLLGSNNPSHSPTGTTIPLIIHDRDFIYIAPELPNEGFRYWRLAIDDPTNIDYVSIGVIVFGEAVIFHNECFVDQVKKTPVNFVDSVFTEAFSNVRNDRGVRNKVRLDFKNLKYTGANFERLEGIFDFARTTLKCLWIPTPEFPYRFFTFAKLTRIPEETHNVKGEFHDFVDITIETDESL